MRIAMLLLAGGVTLAAPRLALAEASDGATGDGSGVVGTLTCTVEGGVTDDASRNMTCSFKSIADGTDESYTGSIRKTGSDEAAAKPVNVFMWEVLSNTKQMERGSLAGRFIGAPSEGAPRQLLLKETGRSPALRPINPPGSPDAGQGLTVMELDLAVVKT